MWGGVEDGKNTGQYKKHSCSYIDGTNISKITILLEVIQKHKRPEIAKTTLNQTNEPNKQKQRRNYHFRFQAIEQCCNNLNTMMRV